MTKADKILYDLGKAVHQADVAASAVWFNQGLALLDAEQRMAECLGEDPKSITTSKFHKGIQMNAVFFKISGERLTRLRYATKAFVEMGFKRPAEIYGCHFEWAYRIAVHYRMKRVNRLHVQDMIRSMQRHHKNPDPPVSFGDLKTVRGLNDIKDALNLTRYDILL